MAVDQITSAGLTIASLQDRINTLTSGWQTIFGSDINIAPDTPDGQVINLVAEMVQDAAELIQQVNAMMDPDQAVGTIVDARVAINNIQRQGGTYTTTNITVVTSGAVTLPGLDQSAQQAFTVADNAGTQWVLQTTQKSRWCGHLYIFISGRGPRSYINGAEHNHQHGHHYFGGHFGKQPHYLFRLRPKRRIRCGLKNPPSTIGSTWEPRLFCGPCGRT